MGPFYHLVLSNLGWKIMLRILCGFAFLMFVSALFYRPLPAKYKRAHIGRKERTTLFDLSVWKIKPFVFWVVAMWLIHIGYFVPFIYLVRKRLVNITDWLNGFLKFSLFSRRRGKQAASPVKVFVHSHQGEFEVETCKKPGLALLWGSQATTHFYAHFFDSLQKSVLIS